MTLRTRAIQGAFWTAASIFSVQLLNLLTTLVLAKLLAPSDFGLVAIAYLVIATVQILRDLGLAQALIYREDCAEDVASTAFFLVITWGILLYALISAAASQIAMFFNESSAKAVIQVMAFTLVISSFGTVPSALLEKDLEFKKKFLPEILPIVGYALTATGLAVAGWGVWSIVFGRLGQSMATTLLMWLASRWRPRFLFDKRAAIEILDYGKYIVGGSILNIAFLYIDNAFVGRLVGVTALGFYTFAFSLANLPTQTITPTINKVAFPVYVKLRESQADLASAYLRSLKLVSMITFPASLGLAAVSSDLLQVLYADKWNPSISLVQLLSIYAVFRSIGALPSSVLLTIGKQALIPRLMLIYLGITALLLWPATTWFGLPGTGVVMTGVMGVGSMVWLGLANRYLAIPLKRFSKSIAPQLVASAIMVGWLVTLGTVTEESFLTLSILISTGALLYLLSILLLTKGEAYQEIVAVVKALLNPLDWLSQTPK